MKRPSIEGLFCLTETQVDCIDLKYKKAYF